MSTEVKAGTEWEFRFEVPPGWFTIRTAPGHWERDCECLIDETTAKSRLSAVDKREIRGVVDEMVAAAQEIGTVAIALLIATDIDEHGDRRLVTSTLTLTFADSSPHQAELAPARLAIEEMQAEDASSVVHDFETDHGSGLVISTISGSNDDLARLSDATLVASAQAYLPIKGTPLTAVSHCMLNAAEHRDLAEQVAVRVLTTLTEVT